MIPDPEHVQVQAAAKQVLSSLGATIGPDSSECSIAATAHGMLSDLGYPDTWYHQCPALVLLGSRSCLSVSGKNYEPANETVGQTNLVTVDLSPIKNGLWGDCARSFVVEGGEVVEHLENEKLAEGIVVQDRLHLLLKETANPTMTFSELHGHIARAVTERSYENLDFMENLGHSIENRLDDRVWFDADNDHELGSVGMFTFEPHIRRVGGNWGFKHENIYYFDDDGQLKEL